jgi:predicted alpha-1,2-mannosidase
MIETTRRQMLCGTAAAAFLSGVPARALAAVKGRAEPNLFIGTGGHGHTYPGPTMPFGMVQLGPDTDNARWDACSGYHRDDRSIMGFSHTHLSGTGIGDMLDVLVVPARGEVELEPGPLGQPDAGYRQRFANEHAEPGYYRVDLESGVMAELTVTERTGLHRYRFPQGPGHILVDFAHCKQEAPDEPVLIDNASLRLLPDGTLVGSRRTFRWAKGRTIHFALRLSRRPDRVRFYGDENEPMAEGATAAEGKRLKAVFFFDEAGAAPLLIKTGISGVDQEGALANLESEASGWNFDAASARARAIWREHLDLVKVEGGSTDQRVIMASALYHVLLAPTLFTDVDGRYMGLDRKIHDATGGARAYSTYSLWDTYRTLHPLLTLIQPHRAAEMTRDLLRQSVESPYGPPVWPLQGVETGTMIGWHSVVTMAEAHAKGIEADYAAAWPAIRRRAFDAEAPDLDNSLGRDWYQRLGYIPADKVFEAVSRTLEYAYDDWAMAALAEAAGASEDAAVLRQRSRTYVQLFDTRRQFMRPRAADGSWFEPYDPVALGHDITQWRDYTESNGWQATFLNQHDIYRYIELFGGDAAFERKLDAFFTDDTPLPEGAPPDISGLVGQYAHGNEPSHHIAYLYAYAGAPWKTQAMVRRLLTEMYRNDPDGVIGNDDCGQMSAWFVMSALGFYPVDPVSAVYVFGSPLFDKVEVSLGGGKSLIVEAKGNGPGRPYVQSVRWNGKPWRPNWISHRELAGGGRLVFEMGAEPNTAFGSALVDRPPSFGTTPA